MDQHSLFASATEIAPGFWLGNQAASQNQELLRLVDVVINCTKTIPFASSDPKKIRIRIPVNDPGPPTEQYNDDLSKYNPKDDQVIMIKILPRIVNVIHKCRKQGKTVLVHCHAGAQRSAAITAAYFTVYALWKSPTDVDPKLSRHAKFNAVLDMIVKKRPIAFAGGFSVNFKPALVRYLKLV